jgi:hypothetical protein
VHNLGLRHARELRAALGEAPYEVPERLAGLLGAGAQVPGVPGRTYVPWKLPTNVRTRSSQLWIWLASRCSSHVRAESARCRGRLLMMTSSLVAPPSWHAQVVVVEPHTGIRLPVVLDDRCRLAEALGKGRRADLPAEHTGSRGFRRRRAVLIAVVAPTPSRMVACRRPCLRFVRPPSVDDVAGVAVSRLPLCVEEPFLGRRAPRVGGALRCSTRVYRGLGPLRALVVPRIPLLADAGRRALGLLDGRLLNERLRLAVQVSRLGC